MTPRPLQFAPLSPAQLAHAASTLRGDGEPLHLDAAATAEVPAEIWGAWREGRLVAAVRLQPQAGRSAVIAAPHVAANEPLETAAELIRALCTVLDTRGIQIVQALAARADSPSFRIFAAAGLQPIGQLDSLVWLAGQEMPSEGAQLAFDEVHKTFAPRLQQVVARTYQGSLDFPATDGRRAIADVLAGYAETGADGRQLWLIARHDDQDVGCLIMADDPRHDQSELMYIGVVPEARGRGWGRELVRRSQRCVLAWGRARLVLAVDASNAPAQALYADLGFHAWNRRYVFFRALHA